LVWEKYSMLKKNGQGILLIWKQRKFGR
jgi:hypothetical protein